MSKDMEGAAKEAVEHARVIAQAAATPLKSDATSTELAQLAATIIGASIVANAITEAIASQDVVVFGEEPDDDALRRYEQYGQAPDLSLETLLKDLGVTNEDDDDDFSEDYV